MYQYVGILYYSIYEAIIASAYLLTTYWLLRSGIPIVLYIYYLYNNYMSIIIYHKS